MLIRNAELRTGHRADIVIRAGVIADITPTGGGSAEEIVVDAAGCALLPGLHDHHIHLLALAAARESVSCGPPTVTNEEALATALRERESQRPGCWIRGVAYHESVAGQIDRDWLDRVVPAAPVRIQHRSGRLWIFNSRALEMLAPDEDAPLERVDGRPTGRMYDGDRWLAACLGNVLPDLAGTSVFLASRGVTGLTDTSPGNGPDEIRLFQSARAKGDLLQDVLLMGGAGLEDIDTSDGFALGHRKFHLREAGLPDFSLVRAEIGRCHERGRPVAFHCTTLVELAFAVAALDEAGALKGDRIEHASVAPPDMMPSLRALGVTVVTQPNFIAERGDDYLRDVEPQDRPFLYRLQGFRAAGVGLAGGTDAPFGNPDPWQAMEAAVNRRTASGAIIGSEEALSPEDALGLFLGPLDDPAGQPRSVAIGAPADLCLLDRPWADARTALGNVRVRTTIKSGRIVWAG